MSIQNGKEKQIVLKTFEWKIYNFIKERSKENLWTKQIEIQDFLYNQGIKIDLRTIRKSIYNIRHCDTIQKVILTSYSKGYKIMSNNEQFVYLQKRKISILKMLKQYYNDLNRLKHNNQTKITFTKYERDIFESLLNFENEKK